MKEAFTIKHPLKSLESLSSYPLDCLVHTKPYYIVILARVALK